MSEMGPRRCGFPESMYSGFKQVAFRNDPVKGSQGWHLAFIILETAPAGCHFWGHCSSRREGQRAGYSRAKQMLPNHLETSRRPRCNQGNLLAKPPYRRERGEIQRRKISP